MPQVTFGQPGTRRSTKIQCQAKPNGLSPSPTTPLALPSYIFMWHTLSNCSKSIYDIHTDDCGI